MRTPAPGAAEFALLCACCAWPLSAVRLAAARSAASDVDWERFARLAWRHRVDGQVAVALREAGLAVPDAIQARARKSAFAALRDCTEAARIRDAFAVAAVPLVFVKGVALSQLVYGASTVRHAKDIDAVVPEENVAEAWDLLAAMGYRRTIPAQAFTADTLRAFMAFSKDSTHRHPVNGAEVELHWRLTGAAGDLDLPPPAEWQRVTVSADTAIDTLGDAALFVYLCLHGTAHGWARLKWIADVAALIERNRGPAAPDLWAEAQDRRAELAAVTAIVLAQELFGTEPPRGFVRPKSWRLERLLAMSRNMMMPRSGDPPAHKTPGYDWTERWATLLLARSWRQRLGVVHRFAVAGEDVGLLQLPGRLHFLYPLLRLPVWAWKRSRWSPRGR
ncbi:nucleotidyltransferase domain-containing protein [Sphingomonas immobilis]|uniref:Nucleotidyltransferase family protein n=1 Tax=Sphingomonas immobilis TaxID=3063997 RepID=A0ABT9A0U7_9SPHN|nr:nucleotidyltransferase family protein [Sphingomonas sp. CA1-15]MDO7843153.1 nucleotidyltransferase family protein [Sphingomonas sp. CA1-15]